MLLKTPPKGQVGRSIRLRGAKNQALAHLPFGLLTGTLLICIVSCIQGRNKMASYVKVIKDQKVIYADPSNTSVWSFLGFILIGFLLLPFFAVWLILWLVLHTLKTRMLAHSAPEQGSRRAAPGRPL
jgi:disulfide bond formation protein DsbB